MRGREPKKYFYNGEEMTLSQISEICGIKKGTLKTRITRDGWSMEKATMTPVKNCGVRKNFAMTAAEAKRDKKPKKLTTFATCRYRCNAK